MLQKRDTGCFKYAFFYQDLSVFSFANTNGYLSTENYGNPGVNSVTTCMNVLGTKPALYVLCILTDK